MACWACTACCFAESTRSCPDPDVLPRRWLGAGLGAAVGATGRPQSPLAAAMKQNRPMRLGHGLEKKLSRASPCRKRLTQPLPSCLSQALHPKGSKRLCRLAFCSGVELPQGAERRLRDAPPLPEPLQQLRVAAVAQRLRQRLAAA